MTVIRKNFEPKKKIEYSTKYVKTVARKLTEIWMISVSGTIKH